MFSTESLETLWIHFASQTSSPSAPTTNLKLPLQPDAVSESPSWQGHILESQALYSAQHELAGHVLVKQWGLATLPLGDLIASCITLHPSDMLQYETPAEYQSFIAIDRIAGSHNSFWLPQDGGTSPLAGKVETNPGGGGHLTKHRHQCGNSSFLRQKMVRS